MNLGALLLFADFNLGIASEGGIKILMGKHRDFDTKWFYDVGAKISVAMIGNSITPFISKAFDGVIQSTIRYVLDRCFKKHLRKVTNIQEEEEAARANTA